MQDQEPNELLIDKACELWGEMISDPKFDALGKNGSNDDPSGSMAAAQVLAAGLADKNKPTAEQLAIFKKELKRWLSSKCQYNYDSNEFIPHDQGSYGFTHGLSVDYHPCGLLSASAKAAGIDTCVFPYKTSMYFYKDQISVRYGYGAEALCYYPVDGRWLVTTLMGSDISRVIDHVRGCEGELFALQD